MFNFFLAYLLYGLYLLAYAIRTAEPYPYIYTMPTQEPADLT
jgi:hypothetical protein